MEFDDYVFLAALLLPVGVLGAINLLLAASGESGTLLLPSLRGYAKVERSEAAARVAEPVRAPNAEAGNSGAGLSKAA